MLAVRFVLPVFLLAFTVLFHWPSCVVMSFDIIFLTLAMGDKRTDPASRIFGHKILVWAKILSILSTTAPHVRLYRAPQIA